MSVNLESTPSSRTSTPGITSPDARMEKMCRLFRLEGTLKNYLAHQEAQSLEQDRISRDYQDAAHIQQLATSLDPLSLV